MKKILSLLVLFAMLSAYPAHAANVAGNVYAAPGGTGNALLTNSAVQVVSGGVHNLANVIVYNPNGSVEYIQLFDALIAGVTLGTTVPKMVIPIPASTTVSIPVSPVSFFTGISAAATTTPTGSTAPGTGITASIVFQ